MTLIIGCINSEFAILAGDTQLSVGDLQRGNDIKREVEIKVSRYSHKFMMGILGKWSWFFATESGVATYINDFDVLKRRLHSNEDEAGCLQEFLPNRPNLDATAVFISKNDDKFIMDFVSSKVEQDLSRIKLDHFDLLFNEPFYHYQRQFIQKKILQFSQRYDIQNTLGDAIFLINNIILGVIAEGLVLDIEQDNGVQIFGIKNTVGGYVTIQIMTRESHHLNCLYRPYNYDYNTLLDKSTFCFARIADKHKEIRYLDNLVMLIKGSISADNDQFVRGELLKCIDKQLGYLSDSRIIKINLLNGFIDSVNEKYSIELKKVPEQVLADELINLELFLDEEKPIDLDYIKRFI